MCFLLGGERNPFPLDTFSDKPRITLFCDKLVSIWQIPSTSRANQNEVCNLVRFVWKQVRQSHGENRALPPEVRCVYLSMIKIYLGYVHWSGG